MQLGELIRRYRQEKGLSLREFGRDVGISASYVYLLEKGTDSNGRRIYPSQTVLNEIADKIGIPYYQAYTALFSDSSMEPLIYQIVSNLPMLEEWQLSVIADLIADYRGIKRKE